MVPNVFVIGRFLHTLTNNPHVVQRNSKPLPFQKKCFITPFYCILVCWYMLPPSLIVSSICFTPAAHFLQLTLNGRGFKYIYIILILICVSYFVHGT